MAGKLPAAIPPEWLECEVEGSPTPKGPTDEATPQQLNMFYLLEAMRKTVC